MIFHLLKSNSVKRCNEPQSMHPDKVDLQKKGCQMKTARTGKRVTFCWSQSASSYTKGWGPIRRGGRVGRKLAVHLCGPRRNSSPSCLSRSVNELKFERTDFLP